MDQTNFCNDNLDTPCLVISEPSLVLNNGMEILCTVPLPGNKFQIQSVDWKIITASHKSTSIVCGPKYKVKNEIEQNSSSLLVKNLDANDVGKYQCCISNNTEERICSIVVESPRITDVFKELHVLPSNRMSLEYFFKSTLPVTKRLQKKNETVEIDILPTQESRNSLYYTIESACFDDAGTYTCHVSNVFGESRISTILTVGDRPVITADCLSYTVPEGQDTTIKCEVQSKLPLTKLFWQKDDEDHISSETRPDKYKNASTPYLTIVKVTPSDQGSYICYASNQAGTAQSFTMELKVDKEIALNTSFVSTPFYTGKEGTFAQVALEKIDAEAARKRCRHLIDEELRIVVIGKTGAGKSATCNTILGKKKFQSELSAKGITKTTESERVEVCGKKILLIDTPGILDIEANEKDIEREIQKCVVIGAPGIHAILFVMPIGDRTEENIRVIHTFLDYFGKEELIKHVIVVFTFGDRLKEDETTIANYLKNAPKDTLDFLQKCGNRYVVFNNKIKSYKKIEQVRGLINLISRHKYEKDLCYYTDQYFEAAEKELREKEDEIQRKLEEMYLRRIEDFNNSFKSLWESVEACVLGSIEGDLETYKRQLKEHETKNKKEIDELKAKYEERLSRVRDEARSELKDKPTCVVLRKK